MGLLQPVKVSRAATDLNALDAFYIDGMRTTPTLKFDGSDVSARCYEWPGANADVCFVRRPDSATSGDFKVSATPREAFCNPRTEGLGMMKPRPEPP